MGAFLLTIAAPAAAQFDAARTPDFSAALAKIRPAEGPDGTALIKSGLAVPNATPGVGATESARTLKVWFQGRGFETDGFEKLESAAPALIVELEKGLESTGFARRDMGVAVAFAVLFHHQTAKGESLPQETAKSISRTVVAAMSAGGRARHDALSFNDKERIYESLLTEAYLLYTFAKSFTEEGKTRNADLFRQNAARLFEKLTGQSPDAVTFREDGTLAVTGNGARPSRGGTTIAKRPSRGTKKTAANNSTARPANSPVRNGNVRIESVLLHLETELGLNNLLTFTNYGYVLLADGRITRVPSEALTDWDIAADMRKSPKSWGRWKRIGGGALRIVWGDGHTDDWPAADFTNARPGPANHKLRGCYFTGIYSGNTGYSGEMTTFASRDFTFAPDGTFTFRSAGGGIGSGGTALSSRKNQGRYDIRGWTITLMYPDGRQKRGFFYRFPDDSDIALGMFGSMYTKRSR